VRRSSSWAVSLGLLALTASWLFGSKPAAVAGLGFVAAGLGARLWARVVRDSIELERRLLPGERIEGADVVVELRSRHRWAMLGGSVVLSQRLGPLEQEARERDAHTLLTFRGLHRGRHRLEPLVATLVDPLGLERVECRLEAAEDILVRPRIPSLASVFTTRGARETGGRRSAFRSPTGFEIHAVREYVPGDPVRAVHWPSTARRGKLMVRELDDAPREDVTVVLDLDPEGDVGPPGRSSFDAAVRAAGAVALAHVLRGRRVAIIGTAPTSSPVRVATSGNDWEVALDMLAAAEPVPGATVDRALLMTASPLARARDLVVVTARPGRAVQALVQLQLAGRSVSIVAVAAETYAGRQRRKDDTSLLRAAAAGIPVAVVSVDVALEVALADRRAGAASA